MIRGNFDRTVRCQDLFESLLNFLCENWIIVPKLCHPTRYQKHAVHDILRLLQHPIVREYIELFPERNFYMQYDARVRRSNPQVVRAITEYTLDTQTRVELTQ